jgi:hypothetical protein
VFFSHAGFLKHCAMGKEEVGKGGHHVAWLEGRMWDISWEGHRAGQFCVLFFSRSFIWGSHTYIVSVLLGIPT